ncbi:MAG: hypothetical protein Q9190_007572 [Brigantiaea leucoxantha]
MATATVATATHPWKIAAIPGIGRPLKEKDLVLGSTTYNSLAPIEKQVRLQGSHTKYVKDVLDIIIIKHDMGDLFGVHSLHRHDAVPEMTIRLEATAPGIASMNWTRATPINDELLAQDKIHATFFKVQGNTLVPFEFAEGPSPLKDQDISPQLLIDVAKYLSENDLTDLIAIEV